MRSAFHSHAAVVTRMRRCTFGLARRWGPFEAVERICRWLRTRPESRWRPRGGAVPGWRPAARPCGCFHRASRRRRSAGTLRDAEHVRRSLRRQVVTVYAGRFPDLADEPGHTPVADVNQAAPEGPLRPCLRGAVLAEVDSGVHLPTSRIRTCSTWMLRSSAATVTVSRRSSPLAFRPSGWGRTRFVDRAGRAGRGFAVLRSGGIARRATARQRGTSRPIGVAGVHRRERAARSRVRQAPPGRRKAQAPERAPQPGGREAAESRSPRGAR
jgi:hypothetical protein